MSQTRTRGKDRATATQKVVERIAEAEGVSPVELTPPLCEVVDPDALDRLFASTATAGRMKGRVVFNYDGYEVSVHGDGYVSIDAEEVERDEHDVSSH